MPGYQVHVSQVRVGGFDFAIRALSDKQQYSDPLGEAERAGISSAAWPLFGVLWPAGLVLAEEMAALPVAGRRILELGCGLGLSSLVLQRRGADVTASDHHPLAGEFLAANARLNSLPPPAFRLAQWSGADDELGRFDLIIGADVLYEREHVGLLAGFIARHARPQAEVIISDPGRNHANALTRELQAQGFVHSERRCRFDAAETPPFRGRLLRYTR